MNNVNVLGVCTWLSGRFGVDLVATRWVFLLATIFGFGSPIIIYLILAFIKPRV